MQENIFMSNIIDSIILNTTFLIKKLIIYIKFYIV